MRNPCDNSFKCETYTLSPGLSWVSPHNWSLTLTLTAEFEDLGVYTLSLEAKNDDAKKNLEFEEPAFVNISELEHHSRDLPVHFSFQRPGISR